MLKVGQLVPRDFSLAANIVSSSPSTLAKQRDREKEIWRQVDRTITKLGIPNDSQLRRTLAANARAICNSEPPCSTPLVSQEHQTAFRNIRENLANLITTPNGIMQIYQLCKFAFCTPCALYLPDEIHWNRGSVDEKPRLNLVANQECIAKLVAAPALIKILAAAAWHVDKYPAWLAEFHKKVESVYIPETTEQICAFAKKGHIPLSPNEVRARLQHLSVEVAAPGHGKITGGILGQYHIEEHLVILAFGKASDEYERLVTIHEIFHALSGRALRLKIPNSRDREAVLIAVGTDKAQVTTERHGIGGTGISKPYDWVCEATVDLLTVKMLGSRYFSFLYHAEKLILNELIRRGVPWELFLKALFDEPASDSQSKDFSTTSKLIKCCKEVLGIANMRHLDLAVRKNGAKSALRLLGLKLPEVPEIYGYL